MKDLNVNEANNEFKLPRRVGALTAPFSIGKIISIKKKKNTQNEEQTPLKLEEELIHKYIDVG